MLFKVIFLEFAHYEEKKAVKAIRENQMYTILSEKIVDAYAYDNRAYMNSRSTKKMYQMDIDKKSMTVSSHVVYQEGGSYYYNQRFGGCVTECVVVPENVIYFVEHSYRESKSIPGLKRLLVRAKSI